MVLGAFQIAYHNRVMPAPGINLAVSTDLVYTIGMDCHLCGHSMEPEFSDNGESTIGWWCPEHGLFSIGCSCGVLVGQPHDVLCQKAQGSTESP